MGPGAGEDRVRRAQADVLARLTAERLLVHGAGMAGLVAAARARQLGADVEVHEKGDRPGGSMLLSSGVVWRHRELTAFREECPNGDAALQRLIWERLDDALAWIEALGAEAVWQDTDNPRTTGRKYDPRQLTDVLFRAVGDVRYGAAGTWVHMGRPTLLATGGFPVRLARERGLMRRSNRWSEGNGLDAAVAAGAATAGDMSEFYGRAMPAADVAEEDYVRFAQLYGGAVRVVDEGGAEFFPHPPAWHESDLAQAIGARPGGTAWFVVPDRDHPRVAAAREAGATVEDTPDGVRVHVACGVTHTLGGIRVDDRARVLDDAGRPVDGLFAAGVDVGGVASGGYASGLAQALVLGLTAAESALGA